MLNLLEAIYTRLSTDSTLLQSVDKENISSTFKKRITVLPSIVFDIGNVRQSPLSGVTSVILNLEVRSAVSKKDTWDIYEIVKGLLDNHASDITSASCLVHVIEEIESGDTGYDQIANSWVISSRYSILFSEPGVFVTSGAIGNIYADETRVHVHPEHLIANFAGSLSVYLDFESLMHVGLNRFKDNSQFHIANGNIYVTNIQFIFSSISQLWNVTNSSSDVLNDGVTSSTSYLITQDSHPRDLQLLFHGTKTDTGKAFEIYAPKVVLPVITIPFPRKEIALLDYRFVILADSNKNICKISVEK